MYKPGMTFEDIEAWEQETGNLAFGEEYTKANTLNSLMSLGMDAFLDPSSGKCSFDSPEFVKLLEYSNKYRKEIPDDFYQDYDFNSQINMFRNDKALLSFTYLYNFREYNWNMNYRFGEETEVIGLPIDGTNGITLSPSSIMGISEKSQHKEVAWDFIKSCFTEEFYEEYDYGFPSVEAVMDKKIEEAMQKPYYMDGDEKVYYDETIWLMDREEKINPITKDKALELKDFVVKATSVYTWDEELNKIIDEETQGYFEGQKNVEEVANIIQSRLRIYINEKK
jgi:ABC-type glycerol-3-phosphate transport system substrate-binding protein